MPRREGEVFRLGTAIFVSESGPQSGDGAEKGLSGSPGL
jgi:hypothetical protein